MGSHRCPREPASARAKRSVESASYGRVASCLPLLFV